MNGLLLKDLLILKTNWKTYTFLAVFYAAFAFVGNPSFFSAMLTVILMICPLSSFSTDELARWDKFAAALPGGRRAVVRAKYQFLFLVLGGAFVLSCAVNLLVSLFGRGEDSTFLELMLAALACAAVGLLLNSVLYPFLFKYGSQKSRIMLGIVVAVAFGMGVFILAVSGRTATDLLTGISPLAAAAGAVVLLAAAVVISYRVSRRIYDKKEF